MFTINLLLYFITFISVIHFVQCQNDTEKVSLSFYPSEYESIQDVIGTMSPWHLDMLENERICLNQMFSLTNTLNALNVNLYENITNSTFYTSHLLKIFYFQMYNSSNSQYSKYDILN